MYIREPELSSRATCCKELSVLRGGWKERHELKLIERDQTGWAGSGSGSKRDVVSKKSKCMVLTRTFRMKIDCVHRFFSHFCFFSPLFPLMFFVFLYFFLSFFLGIFFCEWSTLKLSASLLIVMHWIYNTPWGFPLATGFHHGGVLENARWNLCIRWCAATNKLARIAEGSSASWFYAAERDTAQTAPAVTEAYDDACTLLWMTKKTKP